MSAFQHVQDWSFREVNDLAEATGWLHGPVRIWAAYGVVLFALLLLAGLAQAMGIEYKP